jgi:phage gpG-like protein
MIEIKVKVFMNTDAVAKAVKAASVQPLAKCAMLVEAEAKQLLSRGSKGPATRDLMGKFVKGAYKPSPVGMPPHMRSGNLRSSIQSAKTEEDSYVVGPATTAKYGRIHEFGGRITVTPKMSKWLGLNLGIWKRVGSEIRIPARPFMKPALDNCLKKFAPAFANLPLGGTVR